MHQDLLTQIQLLKLKRLAQHCWLHNPFYQRVWHRHRLVQRDLKHLDELQEFPLITRADFLEDQSTAPPLGENSSVPLDHYKHIYQTAGTTGQPLLWPDTARSWKWIGDCSTRLYLISGIEPKDRIFLAMPFSMPAGPWVMYEGALRLGAACFAAGNASLPEQLALIKKFRPTVLAGKPSALLDLARLAGETAGHVGIAKMILSGAREQGDLEILERSFHAECFDRYGLAEAGSVAAECLAHPGGMHLLDTEFIPEVIDLVSRYPLPDGEAGELVLTNLGRMERPLFRYRTGDIVRLVRHHDCPCGRTEPLLVGAIRRIHATKATKVAEKDLPGLGDQN
jgi:phenylacetate-CoA ligase